MNNQFNQEFNAILEALKKEHKDMKKVCKELGKKYSTEELLVLRFLLDEKVHEDLDKMNLLMRINTLIPSVPVKSVSTKETFNEEIKKTKEVKTEDNAVTEDGYMEEKEADKVPETKVTTDKNMAENVLADKTEGKVWYTKEMPRINKFNKKTKEYEEFTTDKEGVLYCTTSIYDPSILGGQVGHNGKIYNFIFSTKYELPVVLGEVTLDYLKDIKGKILDAAPENFVEAEKLACKYMNEYGYAGRFYYDELEQGTFIYKTKDGYKGFTQGMSFRVIADETNEIKRIYTLKNGFFFSQNYENAQSQRQIRLYPNLIKDIQELMNKCHKGFLGLEDKDTSKEVVVEDVYDDEIDEVVVNTKEETKKEYKDVSDIKGITDYTKFFGMNNDF